MFEDCLYFNSNALARTVTRVWIEAYKSFDLSPPHAFLLRVVLARPGLMPRELASELNLSRSTITRFLDSLEARGFLQRRMDSKDGRETLVYPSDKSREIHRQLDDTGKQLTRQMQELMGETDLKQTIASLRKFHNVLQDE